MNAPRKPRGIRPLLLVGWSLVALPLEIRAQTPSQQPATHTVKRGDTLWELARTYLGDPYLWPEIYRLNTDQIDDPHWIYPGENLRLPGAKVTPDSGAVTPALPLAPVTPPAAGVTPEHVAPATVFAPPVTETAAAVSASTKAAEVPARVRLGEFVAAPWVDREGGPRGSGHIVGTSDLTSVEAARSRSRLQLYDRVTVETPVGTVAPERELYVAYMLGPRLEDLGQVVIPTGVVEIVRSPRRGETAVAEVVANFGGLETGQQLTMYDSSSQASRGELRPITNGPVGMVRWIESSSELPTLQRYFIMNLNSGSGVVPGDEIELFEPRARARYASDATPEIEIARAQVVRVTPHGVTAMITHQSETNIQDGTKGRLSAKMP